MRKRARREGEVNQLITGQWQTMIKVNGRIISFTGHSRKQVADWLRSVKNRKYYHHKVK